LPEITSVKLILNATSLISPKAKLTIPLGINEKKPASGLGTYKPAT